VISIIVPVYRNEASLFRCLESINHSSMLAEVKVEVALVFDGPNACSWKVFKTWSASPLVSVQAVEIAHAGIAAARNTGVSMTTAAHVTFLDADDEIVPARLEYSRTMEKNVLAFGCQRIVGPGRLPPGIHPGILARRGLPYLTSMIVSRETLEALDGLCEGMELGDDWDLVVRARDMGVVVRTVQDVWAIRHLHNINASHDTKTLSSEYLAAIRKSLKRRRLFHDGVKPDSN
jgi:glycosyltransferase involved in cell wall biosynthesis